VKAFIQLALLTVVTALAVILFNAFRHGPAPRADRAPPKTEAVDEDALEKNARLLETVLEDFGVRGQIVQVRPGPVVTLYELEPAPGIKASRIIGLADDIARSMSAISVRVAVVPGRNVIGIELPNRKAETVILRELLGSPIYENHPGRLALILGKDISGEPVLADLAEKIDPVRLTEAARRDDDLPSAQRLGFLLEHIGERVKVDPLAEWLKSFRTRTVYLRPGGSVRRARKSARWKVMVNEDVEVPE